jgi:histidinol-phosphate aminotransferase
VPLTADFELDEAAMLAAIEPEAGAAYLAYPNNPTANLWDAGAIERIVSAVAARAAWW